MQLAKMLFKAEQYYTNNTQTHTLIKYKKKQVAILKKNDHK